MNDTRPTLPEAEYRMRQLLRDEEWRGNYGTRVIARLLTEYDRRGRELGIEPAPGPGETMPDLHEHCHKPGDNAELVDTR